MGYMYGKTLLCDKTTINLHIINDALHSYKNNIFDNVRK